MPFEVYTFFEKRCKGMTNVRNDRFNEKKEKVRNN